MADCSPVARCSCFRVAHSVDHRPELRAHALHRLRARRYVQRPHRSALGVRLFVHAGLRALALHRFRGRRRAQRPHRSALGDRLRAYA
eukprot:2973985-Alexandrium_andersonii.AAC.1